MEILAAIMTVGVSFIGMKMVHHMFLSDHGPRDGALTLLYAALAFGGTLGGTALFLHLV